MKPTRLLALAAAIISSAVAYGIHLFSRQDSHLPIASAKPKASTVTDRGRSSIEDSPAAMDRRLRSAARPSAKPATRELAEARLKRIGGSPSHSAGRILSESQWRENAARVEMEANHELNRLTALLDLDPYQQDQVFDTLARNSPHWLPGMQAGGANMNAGDEATALAGSKARATADHGSTALKPGGGALVTSPSSSGQVENADLTAFLNPEQQQAIADDAAEREEWWSEVLPQLLPPSVSGETTAVTGEGVTSSDTTDAPATKEFDGGDVLIEE